MQGEKVASAQDFGWQSKGDDHFRSWFHFFLVYLVQFCIVQILFGPKTFRHISFVYFRSLIGNFVSFFLFFFCFLSIFDRGIFFLSCFLPIFDWEFSLFAFFRFFDREPSFLLFSFLVLFSFEGKVYGELGFWLNACRTAGHDIC